MSTPEQIRVLYSFPHKLGADRICFTAWQQVAAVAKAGASVTALPGTLHRPLPENIAVHRTLAWGRLRVSYKALGRIRALTLHDWIVARYLRQNADRIDIVHTWPLGARLTLTAAKELGIPTVLERPNAHTRFAYTTVQRECDRLGMALPANHEHKFNPDILAREEREYRLADALLCPSDFVVKTFLDEGFDPNKLVRHQYGFDDELCYPSFNGARNGAFSMLFVGGCAPRKGLHYALEAWLRSPAHRGGKFKIAGQFVPAYAEKLAPLLNHPSIEVLGHRRDAPDLMRNSDVLVLPTIEEGSALVTSEARACGCVLAVSEAAGAVCRHGENALVHPVGDVKTLTGHIAMLYNDRSLLERLRSASLATAPEITWTAAGVKLLQAYRNVVSASRKRKSRECAPPRNHP